MIKFFCDGCQKEIANPQEVGNFKIQEKTFAFIKHQKQDQIQGQEYLFCIDCARKIRENFKELKPNDGDKK